MTVIALAFDTRKLRRLKIGFARLAAIFAWRRVVMREVLHLYLNSYSVGIKLGNHQFVYLFLRGFIGWIQSLNGLVSIICKIKVLGLKRFIDRPTSPRIVPSSVLLSDVESIDRHAMINALVRAK